MSKRPYVMATMIALSRDAGTGGQEGQLPLLLGGARGVEMPFEL